MERRDIYAYTHTHTYAATYRPRWDIQAATTLTSVEDRSVDYPRSNTDVEDPRLDMEKNSSTRDAQLVFVCSFVSFSRSRSHSTWEEKIEAGAYRTSVFSVMPAQRPGLFINLPQEHDTVLRTRPDSRETEQEAYTLIRGVVPQLKGVHDHSDELERLLRCIV